MEFKTLVEKLGGPNNLIFLLKLLPLRSALGFFRYTSSNDPRFQVPCEIVEDRYKVSDGYKVQFKATFEEGFDKNDFESPSFYQSDFMQILRDSHAVILKKINIKEVMEANE